MYHRYATYPVLFDVHVMIMFLLHPVVCFMLHVSVTPCLYRALCFVVDNDVPMRCTICVDVCHFIACFCACIGVVFMLHVILPAMLHPCHVTCSASVCFYTQNDPHFDPLAIFDPFWRTEKTMLPFGHPQKYPVFSVEGSPTL